MQPGCLENGAAARALVANCLLTNVAALVNQSAGIHVRIVILNFDLTADSVESLETVLHDVVSVDNHL